uniref:EGF-like domain-containing protein n=1 Tax=Strigamia maritima TaxID=126957 RepID=T1JLD3_STRMM
MCGLYDANNSQMGSFRLYFKLIWLYILLLGYTIITVKNEDEILEDDKGQILHYYTTDGDLSELLQTTSTPQSSVTRHFDGFLSNEDSVTHSEHVKTSDPLVLTSSIPSESNIRDSSAFSIPMKSKTNNNLFIGLTNYDHNRDSTTNGESVYQWSLDSDDEVEAVYYSIYPDFTEPKSKLQFVNYNSRELRSIVDEELQSFAEVSLRTSELPVIDIMDSIQPTPVDEKSSALSSSSKHQVQSTRVNNLSNDSTLLATSHKNTGIDDIINGLVHLLGDNVKVANSTDRNLSMSNSQSVVSTRINNRGPPTSVHLLTDEIVFTSLSYEIDDTTTDATYLDTYTTSETSITDEIIIESSVTDDITTTTPLSDQITLSTPTIDQITITTTHSESKFEDKIQLPVTTKVEITTSPTQTHLSSTTKLTDFATTEVFVPTEPAITGWRPVKPFKYDLTNHMHTNSLPSTHTEPIHYFPTFSSDTATSESAHQPLRPSFYNSDSNTLSTTTSTQRIIPSTEELSLITANEEYFGDILLTATGVMNGGGKPTKVIPTTQQSSVVKETVPNNNDQLVYIDGRRQYFTLQNSDDTEGGVKSGVVENQPRPRPPTVKPTVNKPTRTNVPKRKQTTTSTIRIDTCIVGDDTACDVKNHEVCRTEGGVSSCTCPPGLARAKNSNECIAVISLLLYLRVDHINGQRLLFDEVYTIDSPEKEYVKHEAVHGITSLFRMSSLAPIFVELHFNSFYAIGGKLATNVTIMIQESPHTSTQLIKQVISRELISTLQQKNHSLGKSHLSVDSRFNPIPSIQDLNECADSEWNDCSINSDCENTFGSFKCNCWPGFTDKFSHDALKHGRVCTACSPEYCNNHGICILNEGKQECRCKGSYIGHKCEIDSEVLGVALGASLAALLIIILTFICLCMWSRRWKKDHQKPQIHSASPSFTYMDKTAKAHCDLHSLVSDNTLQWFPMRDTRNNFYSVEPPEMIRNPLALVPSHAPYSTIIRSNHLSHSQTKLMGSDDCINETPTTRFYVPRPKARLRTEYQNIYSDPIHDEEFINASRQHRPFLCVNKALK